MTHLQKYLPHIISLLFLFIWVLFSYFIYENQGYDRSSVMIYIIILVILFWAYKLFQSIIGTKSYYITPLILISVFFGHLLLLSMIFVGLSGENFLLGVSSWFFLSFQILLIWILWSLIYMSGKAIWAYFRIYPDWLLSKNMLILSSIMFWFLFTVLFLFLLLSLSWYNIYWLFFLVWALALLSYPQISSFFSELRCSIATQDLISDSGYVKAFLDELHYIILTLFLWVNLILAYRPYPIGWDDLGAYMNFPKLFSSTWEFISMGNMYAWELYTGIGFLLGSQTTAFLLNSFSGIIVCIVLFIGFSSLNKWESPSTFSFPLLWVLILMMLPMTVFQLAKDMKLDYGLLFVSMSAIFLVLSALLQSSQEKIQYNWKFWIFIGVLTWFAFSIKVTSLLLILSLIALIAYKKWWIYLYFSAIFGIIWIFSIAWLWSMLNVIFPSDMITRLIYGVIAFMISLIFWMLTYIKVGYSPVLYFWRATLYISLWCTIALFPWILKNISEVVTSGENFSIHRIIGGVSERYIPDYSLLYSENELGQLWEAYSRWLSATGTTTNEDFWRYFWYEEGINNYLKLPWNLTFQVNQWGEFTNITYLFLILLPVFLFVFYYKKLYIPYIFVVLICFSLVYFTPNPVWSLLMQFFSLFTLPYGYIWVFFWYFCIFIIAYAFFDRQKNTYAEVFLALLAFGSIYVFLWAISAFGIVWYGIVMYGIFLWIIVLWLHQAQEHKFDFIIYTTLVWVWVYIIFSGIAHATDNLKKWWYLDYKLWQVSEYEALFRYHPDYFSFLYHLNLSEIWRQQVLSDTKTWLIDTFSKNEEYRAILELIARIETTDELVRLMNQLNRTPFPKGIESSYSRVKNLLYTALITPSDDLKSEDIVFRLGTFIKYYITENHTRVWDDNLIMAFDQYIWDEDMKIITQRLQQLWVSYLMFDLNSATIDNDPRQDLTRRYENLLGYSLSSEVEFIASDSICYRLARDLSQVSQLPYQASLWIAWVNYGSPEEKRQKMTDCVITLYEALQQNLATTDERFSYLLPYRQYLLDYIDKQWGAENLDSNQILSHLAKSVNHGYKVLIRIP